MPTKDKANGDLLEQFVKHVQAIYDKHAKLKPAVDKAQAEYDDLVTEYRHVIASNENGNGNGHHGAVAAAKAEVTHAVEMGVMPKAIAKARHRLESARRAYLDPIRDEFNRTFPELHQMMKAAEEEAQATYVAALEPIGRARYFLAQQGTALGDIYQVNHNYFTAYDHLKQVEREAAQMERSLNR